MTASKKPHAHGAQRSRRAPAREQNVQSGARRTPLPGSQSAARPAGDPLADAAGHDDDPPPARAIGDGRLDGLELDPALSDDQMAGEESAQEAEAGQRRRGVP